MSIKVTPQKSNSWKSVFTAQSFPVAPTFLRRDCGKVDVAASADHQSICQRVLGPGNKPHSLESYIMWGDVSSSKIVDVIYQIELGYNGQE